MMNLDNMMSNLASRSGINIYSPENDMNKHYSIILDGRTVGKFFLCRDRYVVLSGNICTVVNDKNRQTFLQNTLMLQGGLLQKTKTLIAMDDSCQKMILYAFLPISHLSILSLEDLMWDFLRMREMWCDYARQNEQIV